ncbi:DEAD/DEAH box helicase [Nannocystis pusilla]|uniref:DEAD/DEAH box helicase n=1 Tax=Nannocystis pusilla TaxID=889268 RepID=UPI003BF2EDBA
MLGPSIHTTLADLVEAIRKASECAPPEARWLAETRARAWSRLAAAQGADRLSWLRECIRLAGGQLTLHENLSAEFDESRFLRFGLRRTRSHEHVVFRLLPIHHQALPENLCRQLDSALRLDPVPRQTFANAVPDGALLRLSRFPRYQTPTQKAAARAVMLMPSGAALLVSMPTGAGKSLLFQLGVSWWADHGETKVCALVIVPTVALALDHRESLRSIPGLENSAAISGAMSVAERDATLRAFRRGEVPILLTSPEFALGSIFEDLKQAARPVEQRPLAEQGRLCAVIVDEVHIVQSWGRSFRPDFQRIPGLIRALQAENPDLRTVLLSATVDQDTRSLLRKQYADGRPFLEIAAGTPRYTFDLCVHSFQSRATRAAAALAALDLLPRPLLVYTTRVEDAEGLGLALREAGYSRLAVFTGDTVGADRSRIVRDWRNGELDLIVATSAFGMGIDKGDVRAVLHACLPEDAARYYQEIGRGGRDGHQALAVLFWAPCDEQDAVQNATGQLLSEAKAVERWWSMIEAARKDQRVRLEHDSVELDLDLNAYLERLGEATGRHHRRWNRSLLVQLQRYGILDVLAADDERDRWKVRVKELSLLDRGPDAATMLSGLLSARTEEADLAMRRVRLLRKLVEAMTWLDSGDEAKQDKALEIAPCLLVALFTQVEANAPMVVPCGRCPACRWQEMAPTAPDPPGGTQSVWPPSPAWSGPFVGVRLIYPADPELRPLEDLVGALAAIDFQQFVVPDGSGEATAAMLRGVVGNPGLVLEFAQLLDRRWRLARVATALLLPIGPPSRTRDEVYAQVQDCRDGDGGCLAIIAPHHTMIQGRSLEAIASSHAPIHQADLGRHFKSKR